MANKKGWYPDPSSEESEIFFDGDKWTNEKRKKVSDNPVSPENNGLSFSVPIPSKYLQKNKILISLLVLVIAGFGLIFVDVQNENAARKQTTLEKAEKAKTDFELAQALEKIKNDITWVPDGYTAWIEDKSVAYKWIKGAGNDCYSCSYWTLEIVSKYGCTDGLYGEMNIEKNGVVVSYANDSISFLGPLQKGRLSFETYQSGPFQGDLTELNCR
jgi:hypothetical protein